MLSELTPSTETLQSVELRFETYEDGPRFVHRHEYVYEHTDEWGYVFTEYVHHRSKDVHPREWSVITQNWWDADETPPRPVPDCVKQALDERIADPVA